MYRKNKDILRNVNGFNLLFMHLCIYNPSQKLLAQLRKTMLFHKPQEIENSFNRPYGEVEDNIIINI